MKNQIIIAIIFLINFCVFGSEQDKKLDLIILFGADISESINREEYRLQVYGLISALRDERVIERMVSGAEGRVAIMYYEWSGPKDQFLRVDWVEIDRKTAKNDIEYFIAQIEESTKYNMISESGFEDSGPNNNLDTSISGALLYAKNKIIESKLNTRNIIIDISGDGVNNSGPDLESIRKDIIDMGVTVNGLAILSDDINLDKYYENFVIGGYKSFVLSIKSFEDFSNAMIRKLTLEIANVLEMIERETNYPM